MMSRRRLILLATVVTLVVMAPPWRFLGRELLQSFAGPPSVQLALTNHSFEVAILSYLPWEQEAISNLNNGSTVCRPPPGMHGSCCPGSFSRGGHVTDVLRNQCSHTDYERIDTLARQFADMWPVRIHSGDAACDVCRLIEILRTRNETLTIMGDSMKMQAFDGFMCELKRRNYLVDKEETLRDDKQKGNGWGNVKTNSTVTVRSPSWSKYQAVHIRMFFIYSVPFAIQEEHDEINQLGGVLWFNFGLHSHNFPRFKTNMQVFLSSLRHNATFSLILYRETSAQHFDVPGGMYSKQQHRSSNCSALEWTEEVGKRDRAVTKAAQDAGYQIVSPHRSFSLC